MTSKPPAYGAAASAVTSMNTPAMDTIPRQRLCNQHLARPRLAAPEVVAAMLAMQAQEYTDSLWAVGQRARGATEASVERALSAGEILRTHPMRGTHHFVAAADMRWLMALMGPLMIARNLRRERELELSAKTLAAARAVLERELAGGQHLTRAEVAALLKKSRISPSGQRLAHIIYHAELAALVCSGPRKGKHITIALFDERVPAGRPRSREDSLADLAHRYFRTRGPATRKDFAWWCGLPAADVRAALETIAGELDAETIDGVTYHRPALSDAGAPRALLLPPYDEYTVAYADRSAVGPVPPHVTSFAETTRLGHNLVLDGKVVGSWKRKVEGGQVVITLAPWKKLARRDAAALAEAAERYARFRGLEPSIRTAAR